MEKEVSIVLSQENKNYRKVAQLAWGLTDEQMKGMHVHHHPPISEGGRNIPEHLYVCSPSMHAFGWHKGDHFPKMGAAGARLGLIVRRKKAEDLKKLPKEEQKKLKDERRETRRKRQEKLEEQKLKKMIKLSKLRKIEMYTNITEMSDKEYLSKIEQLMKEDLLLC